VVTIELENLRLEKVTGKILHALDRDTQMRSLLVNPQKQQPQLFQQETAGLPVPAFAVNLELVVSDISGYLWHP
jgi:hypothetical protein